MGDEEHRNVIATRTFAAKACREALSASLNENTFLSAFPDRAVTAHKVLLLQLRGELEDLIVRETKAAVSEWAAQNSLAELFHAIDRVTLGQLSTMGASDGDGNVSLFASSVGMTPNQRVIEARVHGKARRVEQLEEILSKREAAMDELRLKAAEVMKDTALAQKNIEKLSLQATSTLSLLVE
jgi:hypothetical protein